MSLVVIESDVECQSVANSEPETQCFEQEIKKGRAKRLARDLKLK